MSSFFLSIYRLDSVHHAYVRSILDINVHMVKEDRGGCGFSNHEEKKKDRAMDERGLKTIL